MNELISYQDVKDKILEIRGERVLLDRDVAELYGVDVKRVNEAVRRNTDKFPDGYIIPLDVDDWDILRSQFATLSGNGWGQHTKYKPNAFTEKGLYMLATILKSPTATQTTIAIVETFAKLREFSEIIRTLPETQDQSKQESLMIRGSEIISEIFDETIMDVTGNETSFELNMGPLKVKHTVKREKRKI